MIDNLQVMLDMQKRFQVTLHEKYPHRVKHPDELYTCGDLLDWIRLQDEFISDETRELHTALGGDSLGRDAAGIWKPWKANHDDLREQVFTDMSHDDQKAVKMELIDQFHFFMCKFLAFGMGSQEIMTLYREKNLENFQRQEQNY